MHDKRGKKEIRKTTSGCGTRYSLNFEEQILKQTLKVLHQLLWETNIAVTNTIFFFFQFLAPNIFFFFQFLAPNKNNSLISNLNTNLKPDPNPNTIENPVKKSQEEKQEFVFYISANFIDFHMS